MPAGRFPGQSTTGAAASHDCTPAAAAAPGPSATAVTTRLIGLELAPVIEGGERYRLRNWPTLRTAPVTAPAGCAAKLAG
jgi:hypothetical protein